MARGSYLVVSHGTSGNPGHDAAAQMQQVYGETNAPAAPRTEEGIARFSGGLQVVPPGLCDVAFLACRPGAGTARPGPVPRRHREEAVTLTLMRTACPGQAGAGARDAVPAWHIARSHDARPGSRATGSPHPGRPRHA
ncbi:MAG TPA: SAM-dependent methyltransferase [Streptosporangiaceae bacterium]|nr:SAM-dependent methyltransferase [Streptosporangiaceae bacterium]